VPELRHDGGVLALLARILRTGHQRHAVVLLGAAAACLLAGGGLFAATQRLPFTTGLYWAITTATTVGYGDVTPKNAVGRLVASAVMLTTIPLLAAAFALLTGGAAAAAARRIFAMETTFPAAGYRLVVGMNPAVPTIIDELVRAGAGVVLVADTDPARVAAGVHVVRGDPAQPATIRAARPENAGQALITGRNDGEVLVSAVILREHAPGLPIAALVDSPSVREALRELGITQTLSAHELLARTLATSLETPHAGDLVSQLVAASEHRLAEMAPGPQAVGRPLSEVRSEHGGLVLGLVHDGRLSLGISDDPVVGAGDRLLVAEPLAQR
jgi:voltage-gated potassium channel